MNIFSGYFFYVCAKDIHSLFFELRRHPYEELTDCIVLGRKNCLLGLQVDINMSALVPYDINDISNNCAGCSILSSSSSVEHYVTYHVSMNIYRIEYAVDIGKRILHRNKEGSDHGKEAVLILFAHCKELDRHIKAPGIIEVLNAYLCDALGVNILVIYMLPAHKA